ncbi:unnamed protein product [Oikopleura dioica]|uniref:Major facilitator superfamily (MFS) profile domain-containing protein n=1 Tax=Oikopleura dioica TaxID=34765 RepID=E4XIL6_OIKDI|nr:unnamed protein product [Oikopleura dioica]
MEVLFSSSFWRNGVLNRDIFYWSNITKRYILAWATCIGFMLTFAMRCNLGVTLTELTKPKNVTLPVREVLLDETLPDPGNFNKTFANGLYSLAQLYINNRRKIDENIDTDIVEKVATLSWDPEMIGLVHSSFFWGYIITQIPSGYAASIYPPYKLFTISIIISTSMNIFLPVAIKNENFCGTIFLRIIQGLAEGMLYPCCHGIWAKWAPPLERSRLATISFSGSYAGPVLGYALGGYLIDNYGAFGLLSPFYFCSFLNIIWIALFCLLAHDSPRSHPTILQEERDYIEKSLDEKVFAVKSFWSTPWKSFFTSLPVWAIIVANFCRSWTFYMLIISQSRFLEDVLNLDASQAGVVGAIPHLVMAFIVPVGGWLADNLRRKKILSPTNVRKVMNCGGFGTEAFFLLVLSYTKTKIDNVMALIIAVGASGFAISGFNVNHLDIAPRYASILMGITNSCGTLSGILVSIVSGALTKDTVNAREAWRDVFVLAACVHIFGVVFYGFFASAEKQYWAEPHEDMIRLYDDDNGFGGEDGHEGPGGYGTLGQVNTDLAQPPATATNGHSTVEDDGYHGIN